MSARAIRRCHAVSLLPDTRPSLLFGWRWGGAVQRICDHLDEAGGGARGQDAVGAQAEGRRVGALKEGEALHHEDLQRRGGQGRAFG